MITASPSQRLTRHFSPAQLVAVRHQRAESPASAGLDYISPRSRLARKLLEIGKRVETSRLLVRGQRRIEIK